ncbi:unnamed protein product, partial [Linum tenue]
MNSPIHLSPWDLFMLSIHYIQKGHLYQKRTPDFHIAEFLRRLNHVLSLTLSHFYPLVCRLVTSESPHEDGSYVVSLECVNSPGARLIHAAPSVELLERSINDKFSFNPAGKIALYPSKKIIGCRLVTNNRGRMNPPLHPDYFGNLINPMRTSTAVGELLGNDLGWAVWRLHEAVVGHIDEKIRGILSSWLEALVVYQMEQVFDTDSVMMGSSPNLEGMPLPGR